MFFTILIGIGILQPLCASAEAEKMYQDIMDTFVTVFPVENTEQRLEALYDSLAEVRGLKRKVELDFFDSQRDMSAEEAFLGGTFAILSTAFLLAIPFADSKKRMEGLFAAKTSYKVETRSDLPNRRGRDRKKR